MKKLTAAFALLMAIGLTACGDSGSDSKSESSAAESTVSDSKDDTAVFESEAESSEQAEEVPEGMEEHTVTNEYLGISCKFSMPKLAGWTEEDRTRDKSEKYIQLKSEIEAADSSNNYNSNECTVEVNVSCAYNDESRIEYEKKTKEEIPGSKYLGLQGGSKSEYNADMMFYGEEFLDDGLAMVTISVENRSEKMDLQEFKDLKDNIVKSLSIEVLPSNELYTADGMMKNTRDLFTYPADMTIAGVKTAAKYHVVSGDVYVRTELKDGENEVKVGEIGYINDAAWESFLDANEEKGAFECTVAGFEAKGYLYNDMSKVNGVFAVKIKDGSFLQLSASFKGEFDSETVNDVMKNGDRTPYEEKLTGYATEFLTNASKV